MRRRSGDPAAEDLRALRLIRLLVGLGAACVVVAVALLLIAPPRRAVAEVKGRLVFAGRPLPGATLSVDAKDGSRTTSDAFGYFTLTDVPTGCVTLIAQLDGLTAGFPIVVPAAPQHDVGLLPMRWWRTPPGLDGGAPSDALGDIWISGESAGG